jgi:hypothetical protein
MNIPLLKESQSPVRLGNDFVGLGLALVISYACDAKVIFS